MNFLDREQELALLRDHLDRPGAGFFVLYGRRRIGKTELLRQALQGRDRAAYHVGTRSTLAEELRRLSATLARDWGHPFLEAQPLASSEAFLRYLESLQGPHLLVLDEFPYLADSDPGLPGLLQASWDRALSRSALKLVVSGSQVSIMESTFLSPKAPLYGRRTGQLRLGPLPPHALRAAFPGPADRLVELAALFGGVPGYLQRLTPKLGVAATVRRHLLSRGEPLYEEVPFLLREELREPRVYSAILAVIAGGARKFGEISSKVGLDRANLTRYLGVLAELGLVEREVPVTLPRPDKSRKGLYRVADPFVATWFALVHPFRDLLETGRMDQAWPLVRARLERLLPLAVEPVIREMMVQAVPAGVGFPVAYSGRHWSPEAEFDGVFLDADRRRAFILEIKWTRSPVAPQLLARLRDKAARDPVLGSLERTCAVLSRAGFKGPRPAKDRAYLLTAEDLLP